MSCKVLEQFRKFRSVGPVRVAWYDDHPEDVEALVDQLRKHGFETKLFGEPEDIFQYVNETVCKKWPLEIPDVCITDLLIEKTRGKYAEDYGGIQVKDNLDGMYVQKMCVPGRIGAASHVVEMVKKLPDKLFCFKYLTYDLEPSGGIKFEQFIDDIEMAALGLWVDHWCVCFMDKVPVEEYPNGKRYKRENFLFGYVVKFQGLSSIVWIWNPQESGSGKFCRVATDFLKSRGVKELHQPFRVLTFTDRKQPKATIKVVEPVSEDGRFEFQKAWPEFDPSEFQGQ